MKMMCNVSATPKYLIQADWVVEGTLLPACLATVRARICLVRKAVKSMRQLLLTLPYLDVGMDMLSFCDGTESDSSATRRATDTATETATRSTATSDAETTSEAASTNTSDPRVGDSRDGGSNSQSESGQDSGSAGLSTGAKAGIGIGAAIGVILLLLGAFLLGRRKRRGSKPRELPHPVEPDKAEYKGPELEGEKWVPELDGQRNQRPAELEADSPRTHPNFVKQEVYEKGHV